LGGTRPRASSISRQSLLNAIRQIGLHAPVTRPADQTLAMLETRHMTREMINDTLQGLLEQRNQLQSRLASWRHMAERMPHQTPDDFERLVSAISQHWYDHAFAAATDARAPLRLERLSLLDFPLDLPDFFTTGVTDLQLIETSPAQFEGWNQHAAQLQHMLRQFPNLRALHISRPYDPLAAPSPFQFSLPLFAQHLPALETLSLTHQNISLSSMDIDTVAAMPALRRLDLSGNRLSPEYPPTFNELRLDYLGLDAMQLDGWPSGLGHDAVSQVGHISLRNNQIRVLPHFLRGNRINVTDHAQLSLQGNALLEDDMLRILLNEDGRASRFEMDQSNAFRQHIALALEQRQQLRDAIDNYVNASGSTTVTSQAVMTSRLRIATALTDFWRNQEIGLTRSPLRLEGISLAHFPVRLPDFFMAQVRNLTLERVSGTTAQLSELLGRFAQVRRLTIEDFQQAQQTLPSALLRLPNLNELALRNSNLLIDQSVLDTLGQLAPLDTLDLTGNRMGEVSATPEALRSLRRLELNQMQLSQWPAWVDSLLPLEMLDLSENRLTDLPAHILENLDNDFPISSVLLLDNPLTDDAFYRARASSDSQRSFTFAMDAPDSWDESDEFAHFHAPVLDSIDDRPALSDWLLASEVENEALSDCWNELQDSGTANDLLRLIGRLKNSGTYRDPSNRIKLCERVRRVLVHALVNPDERAAMNFQASEALPQDNGSQTCHDGVLNVFQGLEDHIESERSQIDAADSEANLYRHVRRLYRVQAVDKVARNETGDRDEAEVRLTYRRELNAPLELGLPEERLLYAVNLNIEERTDAELQVQLGELGEDFLHFAEGHELWVAHLRRAHAPRFAEIERSYQQQVADIPEQYPDRALESLNAEFEALERSKKARESRLIRELTAFANPDRRVRASSD
jgi:Leucine-rich repeat (LRR) protein